MSSNISNFNMVGNRHPTNLFVNNALLYSPKFYEVVNILSQNPTEAPKYIKERKLCRNNFFPNNDFTSPFHENSYLNTLFENGLTENDIARLEQIFNGDTTNEPESKDELPLFPHNNNVSRNSENYSSDRIQDMPNNVDVKDIESLYSRQLIVMTHSRDCEGIRNTLEIMSTNGIHICYATIYHIIEYGISNNISESQELIEIIIEYFHYPRIEVLYDCKTIFNEKLLKKMEQNPKFAANCIYTKYDTEIRGLIYWQKISGKFCQITLKPDMTLTKGEYTQTQLNGVFLNFQPLKTPISMLCELLLKKVMTPINLGFIINRMIQLDYSFDTEVFNEALIACDKVMKSFITENKNISELVLVLFYNVKEHGGDISAKNYSSMIKIMAKGRNDQGIKELLMQGIEDGMFKPNLGFDHENNWIDTSLNNLITAKSIIDPKSYPLITQYIHAPLLTMHMKNGNISLGTQIKTIENKRGNNITIEALKPYYTFEMINIGELVITSIK